MKKLQIPFRGYVCFESLKLSPHVPQALFCTDLTAPSPSSCSCDLCHGNSDIPAQVGASKESAIRHPEMILDTKPKPHHIIGDYKLKSGFTAQPWSVKSAIDNSESLL